MPQLQHKCPECEYTNKKIVSYIDPSLYTNPALAVVSYSYWCLKCGKLIGVKYSFNPQKEVVIITDHAPRPSNQVNVGISLSPVHVDDSKKELSVEPDQDSVEF